MNPSSINSKPSRILVPTSSMSNLSGDDRPINPARKDSLSFSSKSNDYMDLPNIGTETKPVTQEELSSVKNSTSDSLSVVYKLLASLEGNSGSSRRTTSHKKLLDQYPDLLVKTNKGELESSKFSDILAVYQLLHTYLTMDEPTSRQVHSFSNDLVAKVAICRKIRSGWTPIPSYTIVEVMGSQTSVEYQAAALARLVTEAGLKSSITVLTLRSYKERYDSESVKILIKVIIAHASKVEITTISNGDLVALLFYLGLDPDDASLNRWLRPHLGDDTDSSKSTSISALALVIGKMITETWKPAKSFSHFNKTKDASSPHSTSRKDFGRFGDHTDKFKSSYNTKHHNTSQKSKSHVNAMLPNPNTSDDILDSTTSSLF
jgi:hypothetical protein